MVLYVTLVSGYVFQHFIDSKAKVHVPLYTKSVPFYLLPSIFVLLMW